VSRGPSSHPVAAHKHEPLRPPPQKAHLEVDVLAADLAPRAHTVVDGGDGRQRVKAQREVVLAPVRVVVVCSVVAPGGDGGGGECA
jgi:hypothetical protein